MLVQQILSADIWLQRARTSKSIVTYGKNTWGRPKKLLSRVNVKSSDIKTNKGQVQWFFNAG